MPYSKTVILALVTLLPACAHQQVSYKQDVTPILVRNCNDCHLAPDGYGYVATGLTMDSYDSIIQGSIYGPVIVAGDSRRSVLNKLVEGRVGKRQRDTHGDQEGISGEDIETLKIWVDQGALDN